MQQSGRNPYWELDEEDHASHNNLSRFGWANENREVRYGDRVDNNLVNIKLKILFFYVKVGKKGWIGIWLSQLLCLVGWCDPERLGH